MNENFIKFCEKMAKKWPKMARKIPIPGPPKMAQKQGDPAKWDP